MKRLVAVLGTLLLPLSHSYGDLPNYLLMVDISNPSAVSITATSNHPNFSSSSATHDDGIYLWSFFKTSAGNEVGDVEGNLAPAIDGISFSSYYAGAYSLNLYRYLDTSPMVFSEDSPALTGSAILDLSNHTMIFPDIGHSGDIIAVGTLGQYLVIPEPSTAAAVAVGVGALAWTIRRRS